MQRIITLATQDDPPITLREAFEQITEELELAGFGSPKLDPSLLADYGEGECAVH